MIEINKKIQAIPYWAPRTFKAQLQESSSRRQTSILYFSYKKIKIFLLTWAAYFCPFGKLRVLFNRWKGVNIGKDVFIGPACILELSYPEYVFIEDNVSIGGSVIILAHQNPYHHFSKTLESFVAPTIVRKGAFLAIRSTILPGADIGAYSIISAGTTVSKKIPEKVIIGGNPGRKIGEVKI